MKRYEVRFLQSMPGGEFTDMVQADDFEVKQGVLLFYEQGTHTRWLIRAYNDWQNVRQIPEGDERPRQRLEIRDILSASGNRRSGTPNTPDYVGDVELS